MKFKINLFVLSYLFFLITSNTCLASVEIKVMTFNIRNGTANDGPDSWQYRKQMVADVIKDSNSDIIGLQEAVNFQVDQLKQLLNDYEFLATYRNGKTEGQSNALLYRKNFFLTR
jgi:endonuclease/exonuclease/phosphatase family metal-dependent hydrolase